MLVTRDCESYEYEHFGQTLRLPDALNVGAGIIRKVELTLGRPDDTSQDTSSNGNVTSERTFLVDVSTVDSLRLWCEERAGQCGSVSTLHHAEWMRLDERQTSCRMKHVQES